MSIQADDPKLLAYALGELEGAELKAVEAQVAGSDELQKLVQDYRDLTAQLKTELGKEVQPKLTAAQRHAVKAKIPGQPRKKRPLLWAAIGLGSAAAFAVCVGGVILSKARERARRINCNGEFATVGAKAILASGDASAVSPGFYEITMELRTGKKQKKLILNPNTARRYRLPDLDDFYILKEVDASTTETFYKSGKKSEEKLGIGTGAGKMGWAYGGKGTIPTIGDLPSVGRLFKDEKGPGEAGVAAGSHGRIVENEFLAAWTAPFSTFSIDVDTASYAMIRQQLNRGYLPHRDSVRLEEMINYFDYDYPQPEKERPFSVNVEVASCPWNLKHRLVKIGLKGREIALDKRPSSNLVFLLDVSGSMGQPNKLPLVIKSMKKLVKQLGESDRLAITVYAGAAGLVLPATTCDQQKKITDALDRLRSGGSTAGAAGIELAYKTAAKNYIKGGVNRVILCTDGDFNVGMTGDPLISLIEDKAKSGVFLSILGFGTGNYNDKYMELLSNKGNGNYGYVDNEREAEKLLVKQLSGTLVTIAKDVKIQVNFNKHRVNAYRLIGYENRMLRKEDFHDDTKDAGEIGAGHTVTALYEIVPAGVEDVKLPEVDEDKYAKQGNSEDDSEISDELLTVKLRYKLPDEDVSTLIEQPVIDRGKNYSESSRDYKFAAAVAAFGMLLRDSKFKGAATYAGVLELGGEGVGKDPHGYRKEFLTLVGKAKTRAKNR